MLAMNLQQLAQVVGGELIATDKAAVNNVIFTAVSTDTRSINAGALFIALKGENYDADMFVAQAQEKGAVAALVSSDIDATLPVVKVADVQVALTKLAAAERLKAATPVIGITGSNGKTTVKEMLANILLQSHRVLATVGNFNNHIGVPLTLLRLTAEHQIAIIEMGASSAGEIRRLCEIAMPNVSILNNVGAAHLEGFGSIEGVAQAKGEIISGLAEDGVAILNNDEPWFTDWCQRAGSRRVISFGLTNDADVSVDLDTLKTSLTAGVFETHFSLEYQDQSIAISLQLIGLHNVQNALAAAAASLALGVSLQQVAKGLAGVMPVKGRMQPLSGINNTLLINDTYNANPRSLEVALNSLSDLSDSVWLVLGDFAELGEDANAIHQQLGEMLAKSNVVRFFAVGEKMRTAVSAFQNTADSNYKQAAHFANKQDLVASLKHALLSANDGSVVLLKGSRSQRMEEVVEQLLIKESC